MGGETNGNAPPHDGPWAGTRLKTLPTRFCDKAPMGAAGSETVSFEEIGSPKVGSAPEHALRSGGRRHLPSRLTQARGRSAAKADDQEETLDERYQVPRDWWILAPAIAAVFAVIALASLSLPPLQSRLFLTAGIFLAAAGGWFARAERRQDEESWKRWAVAAIGIGGPMFPTGLALALWMSTGALAGPWGIGGAICIGGVAAVLLSGRIVALLSSTMFLWSAIALVHASWAAGGALMVSAAMFIVVGRHLLRREWKRVRLRQAHDRVRSRAEDILRDYEEAGHGWFWETDRRGLLTYISRPVAELTGRHQSELLGKRFCELFEQEEEEGTFEAERSISFHLSARSAFYELALRAATRGDSRWWSVSGRPVYDAFENFCGFRGSGSDLTEKKRNQEKVTRLAQYDSLTGLANRLHMTQSLERILDAGQKRDRECSLLLLDLDRFKNVNDSLGHPVGDRLLREVAQRLLHVVDTAGMVGRLGGDEFQVIVPGRQPREWLVQFANAIIHALSQPYFIEGQRIVIGASVGIATAPCDGERSEALIRNADLALYAAKDGGRGRLHFYSRDLHSAAEERNLLEQDLRDAVDQGRLELYYQPFIQTSSERIVGFEGLLRWRHPTRGWLSPQKFVPIAEDRGLIAGIGEWAIRTVCLQLAQWPEQVRCAVNVSPLQFGNADFPHIVSNAIARAGIDPSRLELEITEGVFLNDDHDVDAILTALKEIGVRLALDDFGTGYSSLGYLNRAPFDKIKIDQSFVRGATEQGSRNGAIIASITALAQALGMDTTAEGVETMEELDLVREMGCSHVQGFIYEKPMSAAEAAARLASGLAAVAKGPHGMRTGRRTMLRKVRVEHAGSRVAGLVRNVSVSGASIEGIEGIAAGDLLVVIFSEKDKVPAICRWVAGDRIGIEFDRPVEAFGRAQQSGTGRGREAADSAQRRG